MIVDVIDLPGVDRHVARRFNGRAMVVDLTRPSGRRAVFIKQTADQHIATAVDQRVVAVIERLHAQIDTLAPGKRGGGAVFRQVVKGICVDAHRIAVNTPGAGVGQGVGVNARDGAVNQSPVLQGTAGVERVASGGDLTVFGVGQVCAADIKLLARQQFAAVGEIARRGQRHVAIGNNGAAVVKGFTAVQIHVTERQQLPAAIDIIGINAQFLARFRRTALVLHPQPVAAKLNQPGSRQRACGVIQFTVVVHGQRVVSQNAAALVIESGGIKRDALAFQPLVFALGVLVGKIDRIQGDTFSAANQPGDVINDALAAVEQQIAHRLDLPAAIAQRIGMQRGCRLANHPSAVLVINGTGGNISFTFCRQRPALVIERVTGKIKRPQAVERTARVIQIGGHHVHPVALHQAGGVVQLIGMSQRQTVGRHQLSIGVIQAAAGQGRAFAGERHAVAVIKRACRKRHVAEAGDAALVAAATVIQRLRANRQVFTALDQAAVVVIQGIAIQRQRRLRGQLPALVIQRARVDLRGVTTYQRPLLVLQRTGVKRQVFACANHPGAVIQITAG